MTHEQRLQQLNSLSLANESMMADLMLSDFQVSVRSLNNFPIIDEEVALLKNNEHNGDCRLQQTRPPNCRVCSLFEFKIPREFTSTVLSAITSSNLVKQHFLGNMK